MHTFSAATLRQRWRPVWARVIAVAAAVLATPLLVWGLRLVLSELMQPSGGWLVGVGLLLGLPLIGVAILVIAPMLIFAFQGGKAAFVVGTIGTCLCLFGVILAVTGWL